MYGLRSLSTRYRIPATYALPGVFGDASIVLIRTKSGASGGVTFSQSGEAARALRVTCTYPSSEPAQMTLGSCGDGAIANTVA